MSTSSSQKKNDLSQWFSHNLFKKENAIKTNWRKFFSIEKWPQFYSSTNCLILQALLFVFLDNGSDRSKSTEFNITENGIDKPHKNAQTMLSFHVDLKWVLTCTFQNSVGQFTVWRICMGKTYLFFPSACILTAEFKNKYGLEHKKITVKLLNFFYIPILLL